MAFRCAADPIAAAYSSDLRRAVRTAEIALAGREVPHVRDRRLREIDYGLLTQAPASEIEAQRVSYATNRFPNGESYSDVVARVAEWLNEVSAGQAGDRILVVGHRATFFALEHLLRGTPLADAVAAPWQWQPGWTYVLRGLGGAGG